MTTPNGTRLLDAASKSPPDYNLVGGQWVHGEGPQTRILRNPADTDDVVAEVREASAAQVDEACARAAEAFVGWRATPPPERASVLFRYRQLLEARFDEIAALLVKENGKLLSEARGSVRRGIDVVEFSCGIPTHMMGKNLSEISRDVDCYSLREPLGVVAGIPPFNFPAMIPMWMMPIAVACGNSFILKPSEKAPLTGAVLASLFSEAGLPPGVVSVVHGGREVSERLIAAEQVQAISFVGSSAVAESVHRIAASAGKRVQALGGAKNHLIVMPDADLTRSLPALTGSMYGCAGQRCLAGGVLVAVGDRRRQDDVVASFVEASRVLRLGDGMDPAAELCPVHSREHLERVLGWIERGLADGARLVLDGRGVRVPGRPRGCFLAATVFDQVDPSMAIAREEVFGPVAVILRTRDLDEAIANANQGRYGNSASIFTQSGAAVKAFRMRMQCGMLGVNLGVPAPMAFFSFGGWKQSIFADLNAHGPDAVEFYTRKKVVTERWFGAEAPKEGWV